MRAITRSSSSGCYIKHLEQLSAVHNYSIAMLHFSRWPVGKIIKDELRDLTLSYKRNLKGNLHGLLDQLFHFTVVESGVLKWKLTCERSHS